MSKINFSILNTVLERSSLQSVRRKRNQLTTNCSSHCNKTRTSNKINNNEKKQMFADVTVNHGNPWWNKQSVQRQVPDQVAQEPLACRTDGQTVPFPAAWVHTEHGRCCLGHVCPTTRCHSTTEKKTHTCEIPCVPVWKSHIHGSLVRPDVGLWFPSRPVLSRRCGLMRQAVLMDQSHWERPEEEGPSEFPFLAASSWWEKV